MTKQQIQEFTEEYTQNPVTRKIERVACYIRVSTEEQKLHGISLDAQRDKLKEYAEKHGLKIVGWYEDEGVSGRKLIKHRPALQKMLHDAQAGLFDRIIFIKLDRFFRSVAEYHECMKLIDPVLWTATEETYDLTTANGRAFVNMKLTIAELEADQTGERIGIVNDYKIKTGQAVTGPQNQGLAYTVQKIDGIKRVVPDPETKELCLDYINHFLTYQNKRQATLYINEKYNVNIHFNSFSKMIKDTKLYGFYKGNPEYCEPLIDKETFDKIQRILAGNNIKTPKSKRIYLFTGLMKCPLCGTSLSGCCSNRRTHKRKNGTIYVSLYDIKAYRCNKHVLSKQCDFNKRMNEKKLEASLLDKLEKQLVDYMASCGIEDSRSDKDADLINKRITSVKSEMTKVKRMYRKEDITEAEYDADMAELKDELHALESQLKPIEKRDLTIYKSLLESDWKTLYNALNEENKRAFWRKYVKEILVNEAGTIERVLFF